VGLLVLAAGALLVYALLAGPPEPPAEVGPAGREGIETGRAAEDLPASAPATQPTQPTTTRAARTRPRFAGRMDERRGMVEVIRRYGLEDRAVLDAMLAVPRHEFVPPSSGSAAYADTPLPIGHGQTISQPYMVAEMTRLLALGPSSRVLEIGTGSGYQAAVLTEFTPHVFTVEILKPLADSAGERLKRLGYATVEVRHGDGYYGWEEKGPFDGIIVTCAAGQIPPPLVRQLALGGRMVIPVGPPGAIQSLMLVEKDGEGKVRSRSLMAVRFVPLLREDTSGE